MDIDFTAKQIVDAAILQMCFVLIVGYLVSTAIKYAYKFLPGSHHVCRNGDYTAPSKAPDRYRFVIVTYNSRSDRRIP